MASRSDEGCLQEDSSFEPVPGTTASVCCESWKGEPCNYGGYDTRELHLPDAHYLPKSLRDTIQVKLPRQVLFSEKNPAEGNFGMAASKVKACWRSLLQHSNMHTWNPRQRREWRLSPPFCRIGRSGELRLTETG
eukprot:s153_g14.t1